MQQNTEEEHFDNPADTQWEELSDEITLKRGIETITETEKIVYEKIHNMA